MLENLLAELASLSLSASKQAERRREELEALLDRHIGYSVLRKASHATAVYECLLRSHQTQCELHSFVIMPNHVHVLAQFNCGMAMAEVVEDWKSVTSRQIRGSEAGSLWQRDYWDRYIRDSAHYNDMHLYIAMNPVKAGLVKNPHMYKWYWRDAGARWKP